MTTRPSSLTRALAAAAALVLPLAWLVIACGGGSGQQAADDAGDAGTDSFQADTTLIIGDTSLTDQISYRPEVQVDSAPLPDAPRGDAVLFPVGAPEAGVTPLGASSAAPPFAVISADFNGDHFADVVASYGGTTFPNNDQTAPFNTNPSTTVVLLGKGDGTFKAPATVLSASTTSALLVGDLNGDQRADVIAGGQALLGQGDGTFVPASKTPAVGCVGALGDVDGDGKLDLVGYASPPPGDAGDAGSTGHGSVCLGNGDGTFQAPLAFATASLIPTSVLVGDLNGDHRADVVVTATGTSAAASVFLAGALGALGAEQAVPTMTLAGSDLRTVALADVTKDGQLDLISSNPAQSSLTPSVNVMQGQGDGTFVTGASVAAGGSLVPALGEVKGIAVGDVDGDGHFDLLFGSSDDAIVWVALAGPPSAPTQLAVPFLGSAGGTPRPVSTADLNNDGVADLLVLRGNSLQVVLARSADAFPAESLGYVIPSGAAALAVADFNGDGVSDFAVSAVSSDAGPGVLRLFESVSSPSGPPRYVTPPLAISSSTSSNPALVAADFNGDHLVDLAVAEKTGVGIFLGATMGLFGPETVVHSAAPSSLKVADIDGDGFPDLLVGTSAGVLPLLSKHDGTFTTKHVIPSSLTGGGIFAAGDLNGDKHLDLVLLQSTKAPQIGSSANFAISLGNGDGTFKALAPVTTASGVDVGAITLVDINGDHDLDLLFAGTADTGEPPVVVFLGNGNATFTQATPASLGIHDPGGIGSLVTGDFLGNGEVDLAVGAAADGGIFAVVPGNGDGTFAEAVPVRLAPGPKGAVAGLVGMGVFAGGKTTPAVVLKGSSLAVVFGLER